jgi:hypothetical protein
LIFKIVFILPRKGVIRLMNNKNTEDAVLIIFILGLLLFFLLKGPQYFENQIRNSVPPYINNPSSP